MLLPGKVAIITGAATGIGQNGAHVFAREGAKVVIADINDKNGEETAKGIREQGNEATFVHTDVTSVSDIECMVKTTVGIYGQLDIFWHNAGGILPGHIDLVEEADYDREMAIELKGAIFGTKFAIREMRKIGVGRAVTMGEVADAALFLVSDKASAITGVALAVDGGFAAL